MTQQCIDPADSLLLCLGLFIRLKGSLTFPSQRGPRSVKVKVPFMLCCLVSLSRNKHHRKPCKCAMFPSLFPARLNGPPPRRGPGSVKVKVYFVILDAVSRRGGESRLGLLLLKD